MKIITGDEVVKQARALMGVSFSLGGYEFLATVARRLGVISERLIVRYQDDDIRLRSLRACVIAHRLSSEVSMEEMQPGDVALFPVEVFHGHRAEWPAIVSAVGPPSSYIGTWPNEVSETSEPASPPHRLCRFDNDKIQKQDLDFDMVSISQETMNLVRRLEVAYSMEQLFQLLHGQRR